MQIPTEPNAGQPLSAEWGRQVVRALRSIWPKPSPDILPQPGGGGTTYQLRSRRGGPGAAAATKMAFGWHRAPYEGTGDPPSDQGLKIKLYEGEINGFVVPDNMGSVFTLPDNTTCYLRCTTSQNASGTVTSATLDTATGLAADPSGGPDVAPATSTRPLWAFTTAGSKITEAVLHRAGGIDVLPIVYDMDCGTVTVHMGWLASIT